MKNWTSKIFGGPRALGKNRKISKFFVFLLINSTFSSSIWIVHVLSFHLRCITPLKLKILKILNFSTIISIEICRPLATKQRDLKMFKMASQVVFRPKNVPRFIFGHLVAPKPKNQGGAIMAPPRVTTSFQSPGRIGLSKLFHYSKSQIIRLTIQI